MLALLYRRKQHATALPDYRESEPAVCFVGFVLKTRNLLQLVHDLPGAGVYNVLHIPFLRLHLNVSPGWVSVGELGFKDLPLEHLQWMPGKRLHGPLDEDVGRVFRFYVVGKVLHRGSLTRTLDASAIG